MTLLRVTLLVAVATVLGACASQPPATVGDATRDGPPDDVGPEDVADVPDAEPRSEPLSKYGNPDTYEVLGRRYHVLASADGFTQRGTASWYGRKFHGRSTSSGEPYDMYKMTAAHKELPLPSYVRVTNLDNDREIIVRVNDRGPFHTGRIIDLSYAAAVRLDIVGHGTAPVEIETITAGTARAGNPANPSLYLQTGAFSEARNARALASRLQDIGLDRVFVSPTDGHRTLYRVRVGPFADTDSLAAVRRRLDDQGIKSNTLRD